MPDIPGLRLIRVGNRGFNLAHVAGWQAMPEIEGDDIEVFLVGGECLDFEGREGRAVRRRLENLAEPLPLDHPTGQRAEPIAAHAADWVDPDYRD